MSDNEYKRRPTAILSADVEGYSRLMRDDEETTFHIESLDNRWHSGSCY